MAEMLYTWRRLQTVEIWGNELPFHCAHSRWLLLSDDINQNTQRTFPNSYQKIWIWWRNECLPKTLPLFDGCVIRPGCLVVISKINTRTKRCQSRASMCLLTERFFYLRTSNNRVKGSKETILVSERRYENELIWALTEKPSTTLCTLHSDDQWKYDSISLQNHKCHWIIISQSQLSWILYCPCACLRRTNHKIISQWSQFLSHNEGSSFHR